MEEAIKNKSIIDLDMAPNWDNMYCGICLQMNDEVLLMLNFNEEFGEFDGFTLLKSEDLGQFRAWESEEYSSLINDNKDEFINSISTEDYSDFKTALSNLSNELISIFTYDDTETYYVGKIEKINKDSIVMKLMNERSEWIDSEKFDLDEISYVGFRTAYEVELAEDAK